MGQFTNLKITEQEYSEHGMTSLSGTKWTNQAEMLKAKLDEDGTFVGERLGQVLDLMESTSAAANIGADIPSVTGKNVQAVLTAHTTDISNRYTTTQADTLVTQNTNNLVETITFNSQSGTFTITKKDGTVSTIDTVLEKVPVSMVFETVEGVTRIKLTNVDGSTSYADVSSLVDNYIFDNTTTIAFSETGTGNQRVLTANIRDASVTLDKLALDAVTAIEGYVTDAETAATSADASKTSAESAKTDAETAATSAESSASDALTYKNSAELAVGKTPYVGENNNWYEWDATTEQFVDTNVKALGNTLYTVFCVDMATGELKETHSDEYTGPTFALNNGILEVTQ